MRNNLLSYRLQQKMTRRQLSVLTGLTESNIYKLEVDNSCPSLITAMKLSKAFNVDIKELFEEEE